MENYRELITALARPVRSSILGLSKVAVIINNFLSNRLRPVVLEDVYGVRFILYPWNRADQKNLVSRPSNKAQFMATSRLIGPGDVVFDVGAHVGEFSVLASRLTGPSGRVIAFEPVPETYWLLRETLALNRCEHVVPVQKAICDVVTTAQMNLFQNQYSSWNTMGKPLMPTPEGNYIQPSQTITVSTDTIDNYCATHAIAHINFLKVDVEGFEKSVFAGAKCMLHEQRVDYICFEISQDPLKGAGVKAQEVFEILVAAGFQSYEYREDDGSFCGPLHDSLEYWANYYASWKDLSTLRPDNRDAGACRADSIRVSRC